MLTNTPRDFYITILQRVPKGETTGEYCGSCHLTLCVMGRKGERVASLVPPIDKNPTGGGCGALLLTFQKFYDIECAI